MPIRREAYGQLNTTIQLQCVELSSSSGQFRCVRHLAFAPSGSRLAAAIGSDVHILDPETGTVLHLVQGDAADRIHGCCWHWPWQRATAVHGKRQQLGFEGKASSLAEGVIQSVDHLATERATAIGPSEAVQVQARSSSCS